MFLGLLEANTEIVLSKYHGGIILNIIKQLKKAEKTLEKQAHKIGTELSQLRNAIAALGHRQKPVKKIAKKRGMSAATKKKIATAQRKRWATVKAAKKNG